MNSSSVVHVVQPRPNNTTLPSPNFSPNFGLFSIGIGIGIDPVLNMKNSILMLHAFTSARQKARGRGRSCVCDLETSLRPRFH